MELSRPGFYILIMLFSLPKSSFKNEVRLIIMKALYYRGSVKSRLVRVGFHILIMLLSLGEKEFIGSARLPINERAYIIEVWLNWG